MRAFEHLEHANASEEWKLNAMKEDSYPFIKTRMKQRNIFVWIAILEGLGFLPLYNSNSGFLKGQLWVIKNKTTLHMLMSL